jgi:hypothetical protein
MPDNYGLYNSTTSNGIMVSAGASPAPLAAPKGLVVTRAIETKEGWVGQIIVADVIFWESKVFKKAQDAEEAATKRVILKIKRMLT